jgi:hypothetical protein
MSAMGEPDLSGYRRKLLLAGLLRSWLLLIGLTFIIVGVVQVARGETGFIVTLVAGIVLAWGGSIRPFEFFLDAFDEPVLVQGEVARKLRAPHTGLMFPRRQVFLDYDVAASLPGAVTPDGALGGTQAAGHGHIRLPHLSPMINPTGVSFGRLPGTIPAGIPRHRAQLHERGYRLSKPDFDALTENDLVQLRVFPRSRTVVSVSRYHRGRERFETLARPLV